MLSRVNDPPLSNDEIIVDDPTSENARLATARAFIEQNFRLRSLDLAAIANAAHLSPFHFHRRFRLRYAQTPKQLILALRVAEAQQLIRAGVSLKETARLVGFAHQSHMTTRFKRVAAP